MSPTVQVGVVSDTHGLVRPEVLAALAVLYVNPGSAGPRRFRLPVAPARLRVRGRDVQSELVDLLP
jgi:hypothetical protein